MTGGVIVEGNLRFDFSQALDADKFDKQVPGHAQPKRMKFVDFLVEEEDRFLLIEVKDPPGVAAAQKSVKEFRDSMTGDGLALRLLYKARDSYTYLHLRERVTKPLLYVALVCIDQCGIDEHLVTRVHQQVSTLVTDEMGGHPWEHQYVKGAVVVTKSQWDRMFAEYPVQRIPDGPPQAP